MTTTEAILRALQAELAAIGYNIEFYANETGLEPHEGFYDEIGGDPECTEFRYAGVSMRTFDRLMVTFEHDYGETCVFVIIHHGLVRILAIRVESRWGVIYEFPLVSPDSIEHTIRAIGEIKDEVDDYVRARHEMRRKK